VRRLLHDLVEPELAQAVVQVRVIWPTRASISSCSDTLLSHPPERGFSCPPGTRSGDSELRIQVRLPLFPAFRIFREFLIECGSGEWLDHIAVRPGLAAAMMFSFLASAVTIRTGILDSAASARMFCSMVRPSMLGMFQSDTRNRSCLP